MLRFMSEPEGPAPLPPGWYPDPWLASQQRYWSGEWTGWTAPGANGPFYVRQVRARRTPTRELSALDSFGVTLALTMSLAGSVAFCAGINPAAMNPPSAAGNYPVVTALLFFWAAALAPN